MLPSFTQLTPEADHKVVQARELLDTIVKENRGRCFFIFRHKPKKFKDFCEVNISNMVYTGTCDFWQIVINVCLFCLQLCMG